MCGNQRNTFNKYLPYQSHIPIVILHGKSYLSIWYVKVLYRLYTNRMWESLWSLSKTLYHCFVLRMGRKAVVHMCCVMHACKITQMCQSEPLKPQCYYVVNTCQSKPHVGFVHWVPKLFSILISASFTGGDNCFSFHHVPEELNLGRVRQHVHPAYPGLDSSRAPSRLAVGIVSWPG